MSEGLLGQGQRPVERVEAQEREIEHALFVPDTSLTKICMVSSSEAVELMLEMLSARRTMVAVAVVLCGVV